MREIAIILKIGGSHKASRAARKELKYKHLDGCTWERKKPFGFVVWLNSRQTERELVDTFFHEMTHVICPILKFKLKNEEPLARWVGYLAKTQFADARPERFGRRIERKSRRKEGGK